ncbi:MAG: hypothetical protein D6805_06245 [Planctomycetota bacterium]|nr:MAG: hypothetical protein D6805_06245 [Planctomycetota bacterium]
MPHPSEISNVVVGGADLRVEEILAVSSWGATVELDEAAIERVEECRQVVDILVEQETVAYGINTGFGALRDKTISKDLVRKLQRNLIRSHACGVGKPLGEDLVRAIILLRANTLAKGHSGVRSKLIQGLLDLLNLKIYPYIPEKGSVGSSGDLAPLSHLALVLMGDEYGRFLPPSYEKKAVNSWRDFLPSTKENLRKCGFTPLELEAKEGLALNNGTQFIASVAAFVLYEAKILLKAAEYALSLSIEAIQGVRDVFSPQLYEVRDHPYQKQVAKRMLAYTKGSEILNTPLNTAYIHRSIFELQEAYHWLEDKHSKKRLWGLIEDLEAFLGSLSPVSEGISYEEGRGLFLKDLEKLQRSLLNLQKEFLSRFQQKDFYKLSQCLSSVQKNLYLSLPLTRPVQDDYSFRCGLQVLAAAYQALEALERVCHVEFNGATDNPLIFAPKRKDAEKGSYHSFLEKNLPLCERAILSGGNFYGEPLGLVLDYVGVALAEVGNIAERRVAHLVDAALSNGLPPFLTPRAGVESGFMIGQYTAAALVSENKILCHPASSDSIPTSANAEDHVSMASIAARKCFQILGNVRRIIAIEFLAAAQGVEFRKPFLPSKQGQKILEILKEHGWSPLQEDRPLYQEIERVAECIALEAFSNPT